MNGILQAKIDMALDALSFNAGDWPDENRERHLIEQIELAKNHLKSDGVSNYFVNCPDCGFEEYKTIEERDAAAHDCIQHHLDYHDGWDQEVTSVVSGVIAQRATQTDLKKCPSEDEIDKHGEDKDGNDWSGGFEFTCNYKMVGVES